MVASVRFNGLNNVWQQQNLMQFRANVAQLLAGKQTRNVVMATYGSSVDRGVDDSAVPTTVQYNNNYGKWLSRHIALDGIASGASNLFGVGEVAISGAGTATLVSRDGRFSNSPGGAVTGSSALPGGTGFQLSATGGFVITIPEAVNQFDHYFIDNAAAGRTMTVNVDGGANTNLQTTGVAQYNVATNTAGSVAANHALNYAWVSGGCVFVGVDAYDNTRKQISVWDIGCAGFDITACMSETGAPGGGRLTFINKYKPDVIGGTWGLTNQWRLQRGVSSVYSALAAGWQSILANGRTVPYLVTPPYDGGNIGDYAIQDQYVAAAVQAAIDNRVPIVPYRESTRDYANTNAAGFVNGGTHWTAFNGAVDAARMVKATLLPF